MPLKCRSVHRGRPKTRFPPLWLQFQEVVSASTGRFSSSAGRAAGTEYYPAVMPKIISAADLSQFLEGSLGLAAMVAQDTVKLLFRACERAVADGGAGETLGIGLGNLHAVPGRRNEPGVWRPAFQPSQTLLCFLGALQARACAGENLGAPFPRMVRKGLVDLLVGRGMRRALSDRVVTATVTFCFDRLVMGCQIELPGGFARSAERRVG